MYSGCFKSIVDLAILSNALIRDFPDLYSYFNEKSLPIRIAGCTSISRLIFTDKKIDNRRARDRYELPFQSQDLFRKLMILNGILHPSNGLIFFSFAVGCSDFNEIIIEKP